MEGDTVAPEHQALGEIVQCIAPLVRCWNGVKFTSSSNELDYAARCSGSHAFGLVIPVVPTILNHPFFAPSNPVLRGVDQLG
jgi:hypothetical protein